MHDSGLTAIWFCNVRPLWAADPIRLGRTTTHTLSPLRPHSSGVRLRLPLSVGEISLRGCLGPCRTFHHHNKPLLCSRLTPVSLLSGLVVFGDSAVGLDTCHSGGRRDRLSSLGEQGGDGEERWSVTPVRMIRGCSAFSKSALTEHML